MTDAELVLRAQAGDYEGFDELVHRHERRLYGLARGIVRRNEDAEDAVQTAFLRALEHLGDFRHESEFSAWISRIAANAALQILRKRRGLPMATSVDGDEGAEGVPLPEYIADWRENPAQTVEREELRRILDSAAAELPEGQRLVFLLRDVAGLSVAETAGELGISEANVKVRLLRARLALRERLTRIFGDEARRVTRPSHPHE